MFCYFLFIQICFIISYCCLLGFYSLHFDIFYLWFAMISLLFVFSILFVDTICRFFLFFIMCCLSSVFSFAFKIFPSVFCFLICIIFMNVLFFYFLTFIDLFFHEYYCDFLVFFFFNFQIYIFIILWLCLFFTYFLVFCFFHEILIWFIFLFFVFFYWEFLFFVFFSWFFGQLYTYLRFYGDLVFRRYSLILFSHLISQYIGNRRDGHMYRLDIWNSLYGLTESLVYWTWWALCTGSTSEFPYMGWPSL